MATPQRLRLRLFPPKLLLPEECFRLGRERPVRRLCTDKLTRQTAAKCSIYIFPMG